MLIFIILVQLLKKTELKLVSLKSKIDVKL